MKGQEELSHGVYDRPFEEVDLSKKTFKMAGIQIPKAIQRLRQKRWQHWLLVTPELLIGIAGVDAGLTRMSWCHVVERSSGRASLHRRSSPLLKMHLASGLWDDQSEVSAKGYQLDWTHALRHGFHRLSAQVEEYDSQPGLWLTLKAHHDLSTITPMIAVLPLGGEHTLVSHKVPLPISGRVLIGDRSYLLDPAESFAILDIHWGLYPHHTWWRWATFAGHDREGRAIGLNLTRNLNADDQRLNENALWIDGTRHRLSAAVFDYDPHNALAPWNLTTRERELSLVFTPEDMRAEELDYVLFGVSFQQPYGRFEGHAWIKGEEITLSSAYGVCELHDVRW